MSKTVAEILGAGTAEKYRDHLGEVVEILDYIEVATANGDALQMRVNAADGELIIWCPSIVAKQVKEIGDNGLLPVRLRLDAQTSASGTDYFTLSEPGED